MKKYVIIEELEIDDQDSELFETGPVEVEIELQVDEVISIIPKDGLLEITTSDEIIYLAKSLKIV